MLCMLKIRMTLSRTIILSKKNTEMISRLFGIPYRTIHVLSLEDNDDSKVFKYLLTPFRGSVAPGCYPRRAWQLWQGHCYICDDRLGTSNIKCLDCQLENVCLACTREGVCWACYSDYSSYSPISIRERYLDMLYDDTSEGLYIWEQLSSSEYWNKMHEYLPVGRPHDDDNVMPPNYPGAPAAPPRPGAAAAPPAPNDLNFETCRSC